MTTTTSSWIEDAPLARILTRTAEGQKATVSCKFMPDAMGQRYRFLEAAKYLFPLNTKYTDVFRHLHNHLDTCLDPAVPTGPSVPSFRCCRTGLLSDRLLPACHTVTPTPTHMTFHHGHSKRLLNSTFVPVRVNSPALNICWINILNELPESVNDAVASSWEN